MLDVQDATTPSGASTHPMMIRRADSSDFIRCFGGVRCAASASRAATLARSAASSPALSSPCMADLLRGREPWIPEDRWMTLNLRRSRRLPLPHSLPRRAGSGIRSSAVRMNAAVRRVHRAGGGARRGALGAATRPGGRPYGADDQGKGGAPTPFHSQVITHRGACGKAPLVPQNRSSKPGPAETGDPPSACAVVG